MNIKRSLIIFLTVICVTLNVAGVLLYNKQKQLHNSNKLIEHSYTVIAHIQTFYGSVEKVIALQRGYLLTGNKSYLSSYEAATADMQNHLALAQKMTLDNPTEQQYLRRYAALLHQLQPLLSSQMESGPVSIGNLHISVHDDFQAVRKLSGDMHALSDKMLEEEQELLTDRLSHGGAVENSYVRTLVTSSLVSIAVILLGNILILSLLSRQRRTQLELNLASERLELALRGTNDGIIDWLVHSKEIFLSPRFRAMLGYNPEELPNTIAAYERLIHPEDLHGMRSYTQHYLNEDLPDYRTVYRLHHKDGTWRWHLVRASSIVDKEKKKLRLVGAHTDITEQKTLEEKIIASNRELEEFTYIASHDLRSPLVNLKGFSAEIKHIIARLHPVVHAALPGFSAAEQAEIREAIDTDLPQAIGFIESSVTRMDRLTQAILELSRLGRRMLQFVPVDTQRLVDTSLKSLSHQLIEKHVRVMVNPLPNIIADPIAMEQVFSNLLDNAIKYMDSGRPGEIEISAVRTSSETVFHIRDNGRGIAEQDMGKIFQIFKRAGNNAGIAGEGMGLPYIQSTLRRHSGKIWCNSTLGVGTSFYFTIPYRIAKEA